MVALRNGSIRIVRQKSGPAPQADPPVEQGKSSNQKPGRKVLRWDAQCDISAPHCKKFDLVKDADGKVCDYQNVTINGYLSTFQNFDRDGDTVEPGAFADTIKEFMKNPVLLMNHRNSVETCVGTFSDLKEDQNGLAFKALLSNGQTDAMRHVRALVAEGHLKTTSMGGMFHYRPDGRSIFKVDLFEGSLVPIPANPKALFSVRALTEQELKTVTVEASEAEQNQAE